MYHEHLYRYNISEFDCSHFRICNCFLYFFYSISLKHGCKSSVPIAFFIIGVQELKSIVKQLETTLANNSWPSLQICPAKPADPAPAAKADDGDDDVDLFGSDSEVNRTTRKKKCSL